MTTMLSDTENEATVTPTSMSRSASVSHDETVTETGSASNDASASNERSDKSGDEAEKGDDGQNYRKVVSHIFGRNKTCTRQIPEHFFVTYTRKAYQRARQHAHGNWAVKQLKLVRKQVNRMRKWGGVRSWAIELKAAQKKQIKQEDAESAQSATNNGNSPPRPKCRERFLLRYLGRGKSFGDLNRVLDAIDEDLRGRADGAKDFPGVEFLPDIDKKLYPPRPLKAKKSPLSGNCKGPLTEEGRNLIRTWTREKAEYDRRCSRERARTRARAVRRK